MCKVDPFGGIISLLLNQLFCSRPIAFFLWDPPPLNPIRAYSVYSHPSFPALLFVSPPVVGRIHASLPHVVPTAAEAEKESD